MAAYFSGESSERVEVEVYLEGDCLIVGEERFPLKSCTPSFLSNSEIHLILPRGQLELTSHDQKFTDLQKWYSKSKRTHFKTAVVVSGLVVGSIALFFLSIPYLPQSVFRTLIDDDLGPQLFPNACRVDSNLEQELLQETGGENSEIYLVDLPFHNAFALPFNKIYITRELLRQAKTDQVLQATVAHEVGHLVLEHHRFLVVRTYILDFLSTVFRFGKTGSMAGHLFFLTFNREHERDADRFAVGVLKQKGISIEAGAELMTAFKEPPIPKYFFFMSTHPMNKERATYFMQEAKKHPLENSSESRLVTALLKDCVPN